VQPQDPPTSDDYSPKQVDDIVERLIKLMIGSEQKVVSEFNRIFL
jgi:hypothetical protein